MSFERSIGCSSHTPPYMRSKSHGPPVRMCSLSECGRYCVRTPTVVIPELVQLDSGKSTMRYLPAKGTAGLARFWERMLSRLPRPPARIIASACMAYPLGVGYGSTGASRISRSIVGLSRWRERRVVHVQNHLVF